MTSTTRTYQLDRLFILGLFAVCACSIVAYVSLTIATIFATSHRTAATRASSALISQIGELESRYLSLQSQINPTRAQELGLVTPTTVAVVPQGQTAFALNVH